MAIVPSVKYKIAYVSMHDPGDKIVWSGSHYSIYTALTRNVGKVEILGPYQPSVQLFIGKVFHFLALLTGKRYNYRHSKRVSKAYARFFSKKLQKVKFDLIIAPSASSEIAFLQTSIPIVYIADATFKSSLNYHKSLSNLTKFSQKESYQIEKRALEKSSLVAMTSPWAINSVIHDFKIDPQKTIILPFGANFEEIPGDSFAKERKPGTICKLLFVGVNWENKGGPIAYTILTNLLKQGIDAELTICGCVPPEKFKHEKIKVIPFLNKSIKSEREQLYHLFKEATFFLFPTRFEAFGIVCCEASAYGLVSLATDTGGVAGVVREGENGFLFDRKDRGDAYTEKIMELLKDEEKYKKLALSSRSEEHTSELQSQR